MNRRQFLTYSGMGLLSGVTSSTNVFAANTITNKKIVMVLLHGGNDTVNAFPPYQEPNYYDLRPTIAIPQADIIDLNLSGNGVNTLGMHPSLSGLKDIWDAGDMALFPAAHCGPNPNRSHFYQFDFYDKGGYTTNNSIDSAGWLARYLNSKYSTSVGIEGYDFYGRSKLFSNSVIPILSAPSASHIELGPNRALANTTITQLQNLYNKPRHPQANSFEDTQAVLFDRISILEGIDYTQVQNGVVYPTSLLGRQLQQSVALMRNLPELDVIDIMKGNWDSHANQGGLVGIHANNLQDLGDSIRAFYDDLGAERDNVTLIVRQEFGRTAKENGSVGTDHGHASGWFVIGGSVNTANANYGGGQFEEWPGFRNSDLVSGRYTAQTTDYRNILAEALGWMGMSNPETAFPDFTNYTPYNYLT